MIFKENGIGNGCKKLEILFQEQDTFKERQVAYAYFELCKRILQLTSKDEDTIFKGEKT